MIMLLKKFLRIVKIILIPQKLLKYAGLSGMDFKYDAMFCYLDIRIPEQAIFNVIKSKNANAVCYTYEEGMASYFSRDGVLTSINAIATKKLLPYMMKILNKRNFILRSNVKGAYFFMPELIQYDSVVPVHEIPKINCISAKLNNLASKVFNYDETSIKAEYIYLEDFSYADGQPTDDVEMIEIIKEHCEKYGKEMIVKLHPRSPNNRFLNLGVKTMGDEAPLEVVMLNSRAKKILITIASSGPINCLNNFDSNIYVIMIFKCSKYKSDILDNKEFESYIYSKRELIGHDRLLIPENINQL